MIIKQWTAKGYSPGSPFCLSEHSHPDKNVRFFCTLAFVLYKSVNSYITAKRIYFHNYTGIHSSKLFSLFNGIPLNFIPFRFPMNGIIRSRKKADTYRNEF